MGEIKMIKYRKYIILVLLILSLFNLIWSFNIITTEAKFINVNNENREIIKDELKDLGIRTTGIRKIGIGQGWHRHSMYIYYYFGTTKELYIGEGSEYNIPGEAYSMDSIAVITGCTSLLTLLIIFIYEIKRNRRITN